jgi:hypothetical protein
MEANSNIFLPAFTKLAAAIDLGDESQAYAEQMAELLQLRIAARVLDLIDEDQRQLVAAASVGDRPELIEQAMQQIDTSQLQTLTRQETGAFIDRWVRQIMPQLDESRALALRHALSSLELPTANEYTETL